MPLPEVDFGPDIEDYAQQTSPQPCELVVRPGVRIFADWLMSQLGGCCRLSGSGEPTGMLRDCHIGRPSDHHQGRAFDWMINASDPEDAAKAEQFLSWLLATDRYGNEHANLRRAGITYVIWNHRSWSGLTRYWKPYTRANPHVDHIHISFGWPGALGETSFQRWLAGELPADVVSSSPGARFLAGAALVLGAWFGYQYLSEYART